MTRTTSSGPILILPGGMSRSIEFLDKCRQTGQSVIGASALSYDPAIPLYPRWAFLPYITDPGFSEALQTLLASHNVAGIFSPNPIIWNHLQSILPNLAKDTLLINESPVTDELYPYRRALARATQWYHLPFFVDSECRRPQLSRNELASLIRHAETIPGMCDDLKFFALCEVARCCPSGDIVEIGSWWGKSAFILARLAQCHEIGKLLCVDPWANEDLVQNDEGGFVDAGSSGVDANEALAVFEMNLRPYHLGQVNYLRMRSVDASLHYRKAPKVHTETFGSTSYAGKIALLHIDGNHSYSAVSADIAAWTSLVLPEGWIVLDDYVWPYGNGPQRAGNELLLSLGTAANRSFVTGSALFIQLAG
jgi:hypothetical protein